MTDTIGSALTSALQGLSSAATRINADAVTIATAWAAAETPVTPAPMPTPGFINSLADPTLAASNGLDPISAMIDLLAAKQAYGASLVAVRITADVEKTGIDGQGHLVIKA